MMNFRYSLPGRMTSNHLLASLFLACSLLIPLHCVRASDSLENAGSIIRTLIPAVAYGTTFYLHDSEGRSQFYKGFFTKPCKGFVVTPMADNGFYGIGISKQW